MRPMFMFISALFLGACEWRPSDLVAIEGGLINESDTSINAVHTLTEREGGWSTEDDCVNAADAPILPDEVGSVRWPPLQNASMWGIEVHLESGECFFRAAVDRESDIVFPNESDITFSTWSEDCPCEQ